jgi:hypothetical protein
MFPYDVVAAIVDGGRLFSAIPHPFSKNVLVAALVDGAFFHSETCGPASLVKPWRCFGHRTSSTEWNGLIVSATEEYRMFIFKTSINDTE